MKLLILFFGSVLICQDINIETSSKTGGTTGSVGTVTLNGQVYNQLSLRPEIPIGNLVIGLDIYLYFNDEGMYWESWNFTSGRDAYKTIIDNSRRSIFHIDYGLRIIP